MGGSFANDSSAARPDGSITVCRVFWWKHNCPIGQYSSARVHDSVRIEAKNNNPKTFADYDVTVEALPDLDMEEIEGM